MMSTAFATSASGKLKLKNVQKMMEELGSTGTASTIHEDPTPTKMCTTVVAMFKISVRAATRRGKISTALCSVESIEGEEIL